MNFAIGLLISIAVIVCFYAYVIGCLKCSEVSSILKQTSKKEWCFLFLFFALSTVFVIYMINKNQFIYYWDYSMHWVPSFAMVDSLYVNPLETMKNVWYTVGSTDYNWVMPLLYVLPAKIFGSSFETLVVLVYVCYMCPAFLVISICANKYLQLAGYKKPRILFYTVLVFAIPLVEYVLFKGFWDAPVLILSGCLLLLASDFKYDRMDIKRATLMVIGILMLIVFRRHWAYWIIGYIFFLGIGMLFQLRKDTYGKTIKFFLLNMVYVGACCIIVLVLPLRKFLQYSMRNYEEIYAAWNTNLIGKLSNINDACGNFLILIVLGMLLCVWKKRKSIKFFAQNIFLILIPIVLMMRSVTMHDAHFYFVVAPIVICLAMSIEEVLLCLKRNISKSIASVVFGIFLLYNFMACFWSDTFLPSNNRVLQTVFCNLRYQPLYRDDIEDIQALVDYLNEKTEEYQTNVYLCASSHNINSHILSLAYAPKEANCVHHILPEANIDLSDGFSTNFFDAGIVVTEDFIDDGAGYITRGNEGVMVYLREELENPDSPIGRHYELMDEFPLSYHYDSTVRVWRKISDFEQSDFEYLIAYYDKEFSDYPELFSDRIRAYQQSEVVE